MPGDHFIPANLIGRFSADSSTTARRRRVYVYRDGWPRPRLQAADSFARENNLYGADTIDIDAMWTGYEAHLPEALDLLRDESAVPLSIWLRVLVPHIAATFVRGREFSRRFTERLTSQGHTQFVNPTGARAFELQRRLAPVTAPRWIIFHSPRVGSFINNDLGMCGLFDQRIKQRGWVFPIDHQTAVGIFPVDRRRVARWNGEQWLANIEHTRDPYDFDGMNRNLARWGTDFIFGHSSRAVTEFSQLLEPRPTNDDQYGWPYRGIELVHVEHTWRRLASFTQHDPPPQELKIQELIDFEALHEAWTPFMIVRMNEISDPGFESIQLDGNNFAVQLVRRPRPWGNYDSVAEQDT